MNKKIARLLAIFVLVLPIVMFFHTGFLTDSLIKNIQTVIFSFVFGLIIIWPEFKKYILLISVILIVGIVPLFAMNIIILADIFGSTGVGFVLLSMISYLPQFIKRGYVEKL